MTLSSSLGPDVTTAPVATQATQISVAPAAARPWAPTWSQVTYQTRGVCRAFSGKRSHERHPGHYRATDPDKALGRPPPPPLWPLGGSTRDWSTFTFFHSFKAVPIFKIKMYFLGRVDVFYFLIHSSRLCLLIGN